MIYFYIFILSLATSFFLMPFIMKLAYRFQLVDKPGLRKVHQKDIPRVGGVAIIIAFLLSNLIFSQNSEIVRGILVGGLIVAFVGLMDDFSSISPYTKFAGQIVAAVIGILISGLIIHKIDIFGWYFIKLGWFAFPFTVIWIVGITNAINLIDGLDGLAAGVATIILFFLGLIGYLQGSFELMFICVALIGACLGFLKYNSHPAQVFLGDVGSLFLGYVLAMVSLIGSIKSAAVMTLALPITILGLPILDTAWAFFRRLIQGKSPFSPDKGHIHHRLMNLGLGHDMTVLFMYGITVFLGLTALLSVYKYEIKEVSLLIIGIMMTFAAFKLAAFIRNKPTLKSMIKSPFKKTPFLIILRRRVSLALPLVIRNLILLSLFINIVIFVRVEIELAFIGLILILSLLYLQISAKREFYEQFMMFFLFFCGVFIIFTAEQKIDPVFWFGISAEVFSNVLFSVIGALILFNILLKRLSGNFLSSPFEFFILIFVISLNLLPPEKVMEYHLAAVSVKSTILFLGYRLLLEYHIEKSRRLIYATTLIIAVCALASFATYFGLVS